MNNLEKLITNLSNYWDISPDKVVDRLNFMNEQEINKIVDKMTKKFKNGGTIKYFHGGKEDSTLPLKLKRHEFQSDTLNLTPGYRIISQRFYPIYEDLNTGEETWTDGSTERGRVLYDSPSGREEVYFNRPDDYIRYEHG